MQLDDITCTSPRMARQDIILNKLNWTVPHGFVECRKYHHAVALGMSLKTNVFSFQGNTVAQALFQTKPSIIVEMDKK